MTLFAGAPRWFLSALAEVGTREETGNTGAAVQRYINLAHCGAQGDPWCAIFANAMLEMNGVPGTRSASSQSFRSNPNFFKLNGEALGGIAVFWRIGPHSGLGHVGFYRGRTATSIYTLGGNEGDMVQIEPLPIAAPSFALEGIYWPAKEPLPGLAQVWMPAGTPAQKSPNVT